MAELVRKKKPVAGAIWGLFLGIGLALMAIDRKLIELAVAPAVVVVVLGIALGVVWSLFGPAKQPENGAPDTVPSPVADETAADEQPAMDSPSDDAN